jgi:hypothetical protein
MVIFEQYVELIVRSIHPRNGCLAACDCVNQSQVEIYQNRG